jgi:hypothetical protein
MWSCHAIAEECRELANLTVGRPAETPAGATNPTRPCAGFFFGGVDLDCPKLLTICLPEDKKAKSPTL